MKRKKIICTLISMFLSAVLLHNILRVSSVQTKYDLILVYLIFFVSTLSISLSILEVITNKITKEIAYELLSTVNELVAVTSLLIIFTVKIAWIRKITFIVFLITLILLIKSFKKCRNYEDF